jgi:hypothetical protein
MGTLCVIGNHFGKTDVRESWGGGGGGKGMSGVHWLILITRGAGQGE